MEYGTEMYATVGYNGDVNQQVLPRGQINNLESSLGLESGTLSAGVSINPGVISVGDKG